MAGMLLELIVGNTVLGVPYHFLTTSQYNLLSIFEDMINIISIILYINNAKAKDYYQTVTWTNEYISIYSSPDNDKVSDWVMKFNSLSQTARSK